MEKVRRGESVPAPYRSKRLYCINGQWFFDTREGSTFGPFDNEHEARVELDLHINLADATGITESGTTAGEPPGTVSAVDVLCAIRTVSGHELFCLPARICHLMPTGLGIDFTEEQPDIEQLLVRHLSADDGHAADNAAEPSGAELSPATACEHAADDCLPDGGRPGVRDLAGNIAQSAVYPQASVPVAHAVTDSGKALSTRIRHGYIPVATLAASVLVLLALLIDIRGVKQELQVQKATIIQTLALLEDGADVQRDLAAIETSVNMLARQVMTSSVNDEITGREVESAPEPPRPVAATKVEAPVADKKPAGPWVINLITLQNRDSVDRLVQKAEQLAIPVELKPITRDGNHLWQLRLPGFASKKAASEYARGVEQQLELPEAWISRI